MPRPVPGQARACLIAYSILSQVAVGLVGTPLEAGETDLVLLRVSLIVLGTGLVSPFRGRVVIMRARKRQEGEKREPLLLRDLSAHLGWAGPTALAVCTPQLPRRCMLLHDCHPHEKPRPPASSEIRDVGEDLPQHRLLTITHTPVVAARRLLPRKRSIL
jgi:hypothetical protein